LGLENEWSLGKSKLEMTKISKYYLLISN